MSAALLRIFGQEVAELPLVATSIENQGKVSVRLFGELSFCFIVPLALSFIPRPWLIFRIGVYQVGMEFHRAASQFLVINFIYV